MNVPIHFHGSREFMFGEIRKIEKLFASFSGEVLLDEWGNPSTPLPPVFCHQGYWGLRNRAAYVLDIQAVKDRQVPSGLSNRLAVTGRLGELLKLPVTYNLYRALRKLRLAH